MSIDQEIITAYNDGMEDYAFNLIIRHYSTRLYTHIRKLVPSHEDCDDILQNTFIKVWKYLPEFRSESSLFTWIYRIATNEALTFLKRERLRNIISLGCKEAEVASRIESDHYFNGNQAQLKLHKAVASLPPKQRIVFSLKYFEELKYEEIAEITGGSIGSLKASYHIAYTKILNLLEKE